MGDETTKTKTRKHVIISLLIYNHILSKIPHRLGNIFRIRYAQKNFKKFGKPVRIGRDCWIGARVMVLPSIEIGDGCIIGANSVVTKNIPSYCIAAGMPATKIRER